jgi:hypothetical protein
MGRSNSCVRPFRDEIARFWVPNRAAQQRSARLSYVLESERTQLFTEIDNRIESNLSRKPPVSTPRLCSG